MNALGILRASALCLLVSAFHGPRGVFCSNLKVDPSNESFTVEVHEISENLKESPVESQVIEKPSQEPSKSSAPSSQSDLVFENSEWDDSKLASGVLFIKEFCEDLRKDKFDEHVSNKLLCKDENNTKESLHRKSAYAHAKVNCSPISNHLMMFTKNILPRDSSANPYEKALKPEKFKDYSKWIVENIPNIDKALMNMLNESKNLTKDQLKTETLTGPYKYGFEFKSNWWPESFVKCNLRYESKELITTLRFLQKYLDKILKDPQCEKASTTKKILNFFSREKKSDVNSQQENSTVKSQAA
ncbi:secreted antigen 1 [Babesia divergens]|uniref:Secreted antigen 1 n=1 Tax=Babesia divergens TaxID=32595 RepID=A0AAD9GHK3_BABDI|nr:secreted antigen 1 [Babesia divergens]